MPRIQFALPERFVFSTELQIYISHVNQGGHLDNAQLLTLVSEARVRFFQSLGYREAGVEGLVEWIEASLPRVLKAREKAAQRSSR